MPTIPTYSPVLPAPATARTHLATTCRYARYAEPHPVQPLKGLREIRAAAVSYRASVPAGHAGCGKSPSYQALAPDGAGLPSEMEGCHSDAAQPTANYSLHTANSTADFPVPPAHPIQHSTFSIQHLTYTFSAKEKDSETGLSYFGSRYYSSDLSIWLSVDPMSDKYPSLSPYVYCADNPVRCVDPDGEDWFENELTGDIYYSRDYRKGDEKELNGKGWKWMGDNNMFGQSADDAITSNLDKADVYTQGDSYDRVGFSGKQAREFMSNMGYDFKPTQAEVSITKYQQMIDVDASGAPVYITNELSSEKALSSKYVPQNATAFYSVVKKTPYEDKPLGPYILKTTWTETRKYNYSTSNFIKFGKAYKQITPKMMELYKDFQSIHFQQRFH